MVVIHYTKHQQCPCFGIMRNILNADSILLECPSSCVRRSFIGVLHNEGETKVQTTDVVNEKIITMGDTADIESMQGQTHSHCIAT